MTIIQHILERKQAKQPFTVYLSDGRRFLIDHPEFVSVHPGGQGTSVLIYGHGPDEEHYVPAFAITSVSQNPTT
jgi:hypothetical protein